MSGYALRTFANGKHIAIANVLSAAMAFTENVEKDDRHKQHMCGKPICTIARELRNRLQHGIVKDQPWAGRTNLDVAAPQKSRMPVNFTQHDVELRVPWRDVRDDIEREAKSKKRAAKFQKACEKEFPNLDYIDVTVAVNGHLRCLSDVMNKARRSAGHLDGLVEIHNLMLDKAKPLSSSIVRAVSSEGMELYLTEAVGMVKNVEMLRHRNEQLPVLELVQFGRGSPTSGDLGALFQHVEHLLEATDAGKISLAEAHDRFGLDIGRQQDERLGTKVRRLYDRAQEGSRHLLESTLQLRWIEHALAKSQKTQGSQEE